MFNLIGLGEHAGSGVPDIYHAWKEAGLMDPTVEEFFGNGEPDRTILILPLITSSSLDLGYSDEVSDEVSDEAGDEVSDEAKLLAFCSEPKSKAEIQEFMGINSERYIRQKLIIPLLEKGCLVRTIPEKPSSPKQKYVVKK